MKKEDLNQRPVCDSGAGHHKAAAHLMHIHSVLNDPQNRSSSLQKELFYCNTRSCSLFNTILLPAVGKEMPLSLSESAVGSFSATASWKDSFHLRFSSGKDNLDRVSRRINSFSVMGWLEKACSFAGDFSSHCPGDSFVCFAHFWLGNLWYSLQLLELEMSSSKENELPLAFLQELELGGLPDLWYIPVASLNEYSMGLLNSQKLRGRICYLTLVSSEQTLGYEKMLSNIRYMTNNFHIIQLVTSVLAFALEGLWYAVVKKHSSVSKMDRNCVDWYLIWKSWNDAILRYPAPRPS
nr:uncharacterized protein LOC110356122 isoform X3 [Columba livia]